MEMFYWKLEALLVVLLPVIGFLSIPAYGQQPRRPGDRVIASQDIPITNFTCIDRTPGYYADVETGCQVYHMCTDGGRQFSYRCPNTTLFQQRMLICAHWYQVNCSRSEKDYNANLLIGQRDKPFVDDSEHVNIYFNNDKDIRTLNNPDDLQRLGTNGDERVRIHHFIQNTNTDFTNPSHITINPTHSEIRVTNPIVVTNQVRPHLTTTIPRTFQTNPPTTGTVTNPFFNFNTQVTTTSFPTTNYDEDYDTTTTDYYDESINNSYNNFINRFIPDFNDTNLITPKVFPTTTVSTTTVSKPKPFNQNIITNFTTFGPRSATIMTPSPSTLQTNNHNIYNNFITRFVPEINDTDAETKSDEIQMEHRFLKRFNPDEVVPVANFNPPGNQNFNNFGNRISPSSFTPSNLLLEKLTQNLGDVESLAPPFQEPSINLELPLQSEPEDSDLMESNTLELRFPDPRQVFFIPENDAQRIPAENALPIRVNIPRHIRTNQQQLHPMLFINSDLDLCSKCHQSFIVDKLNCSPCVIIR